jgi:hypothetical protein
LLQPFEKTLGYWVSNVGMKYGHPEYSGITVEFLNEFAEQSPRHPALVDDLFGI